MIQSKFVEAYEFGVMMVPYPHDDRYWTHQALFPFPMKEWTDRDDLWKRRMFLFAFDIGRSCKRLTRETFICLEKLFQLLETTKKLELKDLAIPFSLIFCSMRFNILEQHIRDLNVIIERR